MLPLYYVVKIFGAITGIVCYQIPKCFVLYPIIIKVFKTRIILHPEANFELMIALI